MYLRGVIGGTTLAFLTLSPAMAVAERVTGFIYEDVDASATSAYAQPLDGADNAWADLYVGLRNRDGKTGVYTNNDGRFEVDLDEGTWLITPGRNQYSHASSHNVGLYIPDAVDRGAIKVVAFGDSLTNYGSEPYPSLLREHLQELAPTELVNVAKGGSEAAQWVPEQIYFEERLRPQLIEADVVVFTLGGNDFAHHFNGLNGDPAAFVMAMLSLPSLMVQIQTDLTLIVEAVREEVPSADIVYVVSPNYANQSSFEESSGDLWPITQAMVGGMMGYLRGHMAEIPTLVLADMLGRYEGEMLDPYLADGWHPNAQGRQDIADEVFVCLGGVVVGEADVGLERSVGLIVP